MKRNHPLFFSAALVLAILPAQGAAAMSAGFNAGLVSPRHLRTTVGAGGLLDFEFDLGSSGSIHFQPTVEFWYSSDDHYYYYVGRYSYPYWWRVFELSINPNGRYYLPLPRSLPIQPFLGLGIALSFPSVEYEYVYPDYPPPYYDDHFDIGYNVLAGVDFKMGPSAKGFVELRGKLGYIDVSKILFGMLFPIRR
jgi:hypothetical protein